MGELRIDDESVSYWTWYGRKKVSMNKLFGAAPENIKSNKYLNFNYLVDNFQGYQRTRWNFRFYDPVSGPVMNVDRSALDGNQLTREAIILHIKNRFDTKRPVAEIPDYRYESTCDKVFRTLTEDYNVKIEFRCDGKTIYVCRITEYQIAGEGDAVLNLTDPEHHLAGFEYNVPVRDVEAMKVVKSREAGLSSASTVWLILKPGSVTDVIRFEAGFLTHYKKLEHYCRCLPTLFPDLESENDSGYLSP